MPDKDCTLNNLQVGDNLYSIAFGPVVVQRVSGAHIYASGREWFRDGRFNYGGIRDLYWGKPSIFHTEFRPHREITIERWVNVMLFPGGDITTSTYRSKEDADSSAFISAGKRLGEAEHVVYTRIIEDEA
jgi:hypothetical protein